MSTTVAWLDQGARVGVCVRCIIKPLAKRPDLTDLQPATIEDARGKACIICNGPLAYEVGAPAAEWEGPPRVSAEIDELAELRRAEAFDAEDIEGELLADEARIERRAA